MPPLYDQLTLVLAWPEIGFWETVLTLPLPDRETVERGSASIWTAPLPESRTFEALTMYDGDDRVDEVAVEAGHIIAGPQVLSRNEQAVIVLSRLTEIGPILSLELLTVTRTAHPVGMGSRLGIRLAVVRDEMAHLLVDNRGETAGGDEGVLDTREYAFVRPPGDDLDFFVGLPEAGLPDVRIQLPLNSR